MLRLVLVVVLICSLSAAADEKQQVKQDRGKPKMAVDLVEIKFCRRLSVPDDFPRDALVPVDPPALEIVFLIGGQHLAEVKHQSLVLKTFQTAKGRDLLKKQNEPPYQQMYSHLFLPPTHQGKYLSFAIGSNELAIDELEGSRLQGSITVFAADGKEEFASKPVDLSQRSQFRVQDFAVTVADETVSSGLGPLGSGAFADQGDSKEAPVGPATEAMKNVSYLFSIEGDLASVADIEVVQGEEKLEQIGFSRSDDRGEFEYRKAADGECVIRIQTWKNRREVVVPFEAKLSLKTK